jgi:Family of unknown function (DUF5995)
MEALCAALPAGDGLACFNHTYLGVVQQIAQRLSQGFFRNPVTVTHLDLIFANLYFAAADTGGHTGFNDLAGTAGAAIRSNGDYIWAGTEFE